MEKNDDQTLEGGATEGAIDLTLEPANPGDPKPEEGGGKQEGDAGSGDPLDDITDAEARAEAKRARAEQRRRDKEAKEKGDVPEPKSSEFLTRKDYEKSNERKAVLVATQDEEVKANWADIIQYYTPRRGKATPEDIIEDIKDAVTLYKARNQTEEKDNPAAPLLTTTAPKGTGGGVAPNKATVNPPNFKLPTQPDTWYPKQS